MTLVITSWSALSPFGVGRDDFRNGIRSGSSALLEAPSDENSPPNSRVGLVRGFDLRNALGTKGTRVMDRVTGLVVSAVGQVLDDVATNTQEYTDMGLVLGTTTGSLSSIMEFVKDSFTQAKPFHVEPARFPNVVMNHAAGRCAIWHEIRGPNATVAGGRAAAVPVLQYAARLFQRNRAAIVLCVMAEEFSAHRAWVECLAINGVNDRALSEGCTVFALEPAEAARQAGRTAIAEVMRIEHGVWGTYAPVYDVLTRLMRSALRTPGISACDVDLVVLSGAPATDPLQGFAAEERAAVQELLPNSTIATVTDLTGDAGAATGGFQLAALLSANPSIARPYSLFTSVDVDGVVGCVLIRREQ